MGHMYSYGGLVNRVGLKSWWRGRETGKQDPSQTSPLLLSEKLNFFFLLSFFTVPLLNELSYLLRVFLSCRFHIAFRCLNSFKVLTAGAVVYFFVSVRCA